MSYIGQVSPKPLRLKASFKSVISGGSRGFQDLRREGARQPTLQAHSEKLPRYSQGPNGDNVSHVPRYYFASDSSNIFVIVV